MTIVDFECEGFRDLTLGFNWEAKWEIGPDSRVSNIHARGKGFRFSQSYDTNLSHAQLSPSPQTHSLTPPRQLLYGPTVGTRKIWFLGRPASNTESKYEILWTAGIDLGLNLESTAVIDLGLDLESTAGMDLGLNLESRDKYLTGSWAWDSALLLRWRSPFFLNI